MNYESLNYGIFESLNYGILESLNYGIFESLNHGIYSSYNKYFCRCFLYFSTSSFHIAFISAADFPS